jgi:phthiocerol/phenolphthiocerol synthesis type-I polyketide synthase D
MTASSQAILSDEDSISLWLRNYVAQSLHIDAASVPIDTHLVDLGLSSREAVAMTADLEDTFGRPGVAEIDPAFVFEYPTIRGLAKHLAAELAAGGSQGSFSAGSP